MSLSYINFYFHNFTRDKDFLKFIFARKIFYLWSKLDERFFSEIKGEQERLQLNITKSFETLRKTEFMVKNRQKCYYDDRKKSVH